MKLFFQPIPHQEAIDFLSTRPVVTREVFDELTPELRGLAFVITGIDDAVQLQAAKNILAKLPAGGDYRKVREELIAALPWAGKKAERRAELLLRHWGGIAYAHAQYRIMDRQRDIFPWWQYVTMQDGRVRATHVALGGIILRHDSPFWKGHYPPWEPLCRCSVIPLMDDDVDEIRAAEANKPEDERLVLEGPILDKLLQSQTLIRGLNNVYDVRTPAEKGEPWIGWDPDNITKGIDLNKIQQKLDPDVWQKLLTFWGKKWIDPQTPLLTWLAGLQPNANLPRVPTATPPPAAPAATPPSETPASTSLSSSPVRPASYDPARQVAAHLTPGTSRGRANDLTTALSDLVAQIHSNGGLRTSRIISVQIASEGQFIQNTSFARLRADPLDWTAEIRINPKTKHPLHVFAHELGHQIDYQVIRTSRDHVVNPAALQIRQQIIAACQASARAKDIAAYPHTAHRLYMEKEVEWFARAYAQYLTLRTQHPELLRAVADSLKSTSSARLDIWEDTDFAPIAPLFDQLFITLGWSVPA